MKPAIVGLSGPSLLSEEAALLREHAPAGIILFARNIQDPGQLSTLSASVRDALPGDALLMVDQEGGRVARLRPPHWGAHPPARAIGDLHARDPERGLRAAWLTGAAIGAECAAAGFDVVAAPVLDVGAAHQVIGDRAFSGDPDAVAVLGGAFAQGLLEGGVQPVGKHAPGHGRARADSHLELPELDAIDPADLVPFCVNAWLPWLMTAHIRYRKSDMANPATLSPTIISGVIRGQPIGFGGVLVTDDLAMHALSGTPGSRAARALQAGCDVALHCSGQIEETRSVLEAVPPMSDRTAQRLAAARDMVLCSRTPPDLVAWREERDALLA